MDKLKILWTDTGGVQWKGGRGIIRAWREEMEKRGWLIEVDPKKWMDCDLVFYGSDSQLHQHPEPLGKKPTTLYFWGWDPGKLLGPFKAQAVEILKMMAMCTRILTPSVVTMYQVADFGLPSVLCLPGVDSRVLDKGDPGPRKHQVMFLSRLVEHKHLDSLIQAMTLLENAPKILAVGPGDNQPYVELAKTLKVDIEFVELDDFQKSTELRQSLLLVQSSSYEGFGLPPLEALYCHTPVVAFDIPQTRWMLQEDAYYFSSIPGLAETVAHVYNNYGEAQKKADHGAERIRNSLTLEHACDRLWPHLHQVHKEFWAQVIRREPTRWREAYDQEHKRNWAYSVDRFDPTWARHWRAQTFIDLLKECKAERILDIGCGAVYPTIFARAGFDITAMDISTECLRQVGVVAEKWGVRDKVHPYQGDAQSLDFDGDTFDAVVEAELWEHVLDVEKIISEGLRVLKCGGYLIATSPIGTHHFDPFHIRTFDDQSIQVLVNKFSDRANCKRLEKIAEQGAEPSCYLVVLEKR